MPYADRSGRTRRAAQIDPRAAVTLARFDPHLPVAATIASYTSSVTHTTGTAIAYSSAATIAPIEMIRSRSFSTIATGPVPLRTASASTLLLELGLRVRHHHHLPARLAPACGCPRSTIFPAPES